MQDTQSISNQQEIKTTSSLNLFFKRFGIRDLLRKSNISKIRGVTVINLLINIMRLPFIHKNFYQSIVEGDDVGFGKTAAYDFLNNSKYNWRIFLLNTVTVIINSFIMPLTDSKRENVLIIDDSLYPRNRSKRVELLARIYDHVSHRYSKGFRLFQLCWSDGNSLLPIDFALLSSPKKTNRYQEINPKIDKRSCGYKRRKEATYKSTDLIIPMIKRTLKYGIKADYLLLDSWFGFPSIISGVRKYIDVICMVKKMPKVFYYVGDKALTLSGLHKSIKKKRGNANIKGSVIAEIEHDGQRGQVKIVYVKNRNKKRAWLAILSTNTGLSDEDIVRIYGKRWDIEVFFKMAKQHLKLTNETQLRSYDSMIAHITIVMLRYMFITVCQRDSTDSKTFGGMFYDMIDEMKDITLVDSLLRIVDIVADNMKTALNETDQFVDRMIDLFIEVIADKYGIWLRNE